MKKTYIKPAAIELALELWPLMQEISNLGGNQGTYTGGQLSRPSSMWDDDEEE